MEGLREYVLSVSAAAILVGILMSLLRSKDTASVLIRMIAGLFLAFTALRPIAALDVGDIGNYLAAFSADGDSAAAQGEYLARDAYCSYIKAETEAYILDKADVYDAELTVEVRLDEGDMAIPVAARIEGRISPYAKACLQEMIETDLGISKENQLWIS